MVLPESAVRTEQEDIGPKPAEGPKAEPKQEDIGPKPAKRHHTTGKDYMSRAKLQVKLNSHAIHV